MGLSCHLFVLLSTLRLVDKTNEHYEQAWWSIISNIPLLEKYWDEIYLISKEEITFAYKGGIAYCLWAELPVEKILDRRRILSNILYSIWQLLKEDPDLKTFLTNDSASTNEDQMSALPYKAGYPSHYVHKSSPRLPRLPPSDKPYEEVSQNPSIWTLFTPTGLLAITDPRHSNYIGVET